MKLEIKAILWMALILISLIALIGPICARKNKVKKWRNTLQVDKNESCFNDIYFQINGFEISKKARKNKDDFAFIYGEIQFQSFIALLSLCKPDDKTIFYDLGSGIGKAVIAAAMIFPLKKAIGIECLQPLHEAAQKAKERLAHFADYQNKAFVIELKCNDFLKYDWSDANLVFINATAIIGDLWTQLLDKLGHLCDGTIIITTKAIPLKPFFLVSSTDVLMSWGIVKAYIHEKRAEDNSSTVPRNSTL